MTTFPRLIRLYYRLTRWQGYGVEAMSLRWTCHKTRDYITIEGY